MLWHLTAHHMTPVMRKPAFCICKNKDAYQLGGNRQADQRLCFHICKKYILPKLTFKSLAIFCGCTAWFVSDLVENPEDRFSHNAAQLCIGGGGGAALHDKTSNICLQLIMHKAKFNVYPHELENDHLHKKRKTDIHMS